MRATRRANGSFNFSRLSGTGRLTLGNGAANLGMSNLNTADALDFNGTLALRDAIAKDFERRFGVPVIADEQVTVWCGSSEAMMAVMMAAKVFSMCSACRVSCSDQCHEKRRTGMPHLSVTTGSRSQ